MSVTAIKPLRPQDHAPAPPKAGSAVLLASFLINSLSLALPIVILQVYDRVLPNQAVETLVVLALGLCVALVTDTVLQILRSAIMRWNAARYEHALGCASVTRLLKTDIGTIEKSPASTHLDNLNAADTLREFHGGAARLLIVDLPFVALFLGFIWIIAGVLVLVPIGLMLVMAVATQWVGRTLRAAIDDRAVSDDRRYSFIIEALSGIETLKGMTAESLILRRYERLQAASAACAYRMTFLSALSQALGAYMSNIIMVSVIVAGAYLVVTGSLSVGALAACTLLTGRTIHPIMRALSFWTQFQKVSKAKESAKAIFELPIPSGETTTTSHDQPATIDFENVSFAFDDGETKVLDGVSFSIKAGDCVGITGASGSGKTTLLMLMMGLVLPTKGRVLIDGVDTKSGDPTAMAGRFTHIPQRTILFDGSILDNLLLLSADADEEAALAQTRRLGLDRVVNRLPEGYSTRVGTGASYHLPAGVEQGLTIARGLIDCGGSLIFDDANSALDRDVDENLKTIFANMQGSKTLIFVSHRPSFLKTADWVIELENGQIKSEKPTPAALSIGSRNSPATERAS